MRTTHFSKYPILTLGLLFSGCLYSTHHFNTGRTVPAGVSTFTMGFGTQRFTSEHCPEIVKNKTAENPWGDYYYGYLDWEDHICHYSSGFGYDPFDDTSRPDTFTTDPSLNKTILPKFSLGYRIGVRDSWGPFTGVDIGFQFEAPSFYATALFDMRLGLPRLPIKNVHHALGAGFLIGAWADNGYFGDYAISKSFGKNELYSSFRILYHNTLITQMEDMAENFKIPHKRRWVYQSALGGKWVLPELKIMPDFLTPQFTATFPTVHVTSDERGDNLYRKKIELKFNLGMGWDF